MDTITALWQTLFCVSVLHMFIHLILTTLGKQCYSTHCKDEGPQAQRPLCKFRKVTQLVSSRPEFVPGQYGSSVHTLNYHATFHRGEQEESGGMVSGEWKKDEEVQEHKFLRPITYQGLLIKR